MSIIRTTEGKFVTETVGGRSVYTDNFEAYANKNSFFGGDEGVIFGEPIDPAEKVSDNAFIPIVYIEKDNDNIYKIIETKDQVSLSQYIEQGKRTFFVKEIRFSPKRESVKVYFSIKKGNFKANDSDGGDIVIMYFDKEHRKIKEEKIRNKNYGDIFSINWDKSVYEIQFYAYDNDIFFDGSIENVYCGVVRKSNSISTIRKIWEAYPKIKDYKSHYEMYDLVGGELAKWHTAILTDNDKKNDNDLNNTCALRMSRALNYSGFEIPEIKEETYKGGDNKNYFIRVALLKKYLTEILFASFPLKEVTLEEEEVLFIEEDCNWVNATGHIDISVDGDVGSHIYYECNRIIGWINLD